MKKVIYGMLVFVLLAIGIAIAYFSFPQCEFKLEEYTMSRKVYVVSLYRDRMLVVKYGYKKPERGGLKEDYQRDKSFHIDIITKVVIKRLTKEEYADIKELCNQAISEGLRYRPLSSADNHDPRVYWSAVFKIDNKMSNIRFAWDHVYQGKPVLLEIVKKLSVLSPMQITDTSGNPIWIYDMRDERYKGQDYLSTLDWLDRVMYRIWPTYVYYGPLEDDWLDFILWKVFPADKSKETGFYTY